MAIPTIGATITTDATTSGGETPTWNTVSHTTDAGTDLLVVFVTIGNSADRDPTTVTWNSESLTLLDAIVDGTFTRTQLWYLKSPSIASAGVAITWSDTAARMGMTAINITGSDPVATFGTSITAVGNSTAPQLTVVSATGELAIAGVTFRNANGILSEISVTELSNFDHASQFGGEYATGWKAGAAATLMDWSDSVSSPWTMVGVAVKPLAVTPTTGGGSTHIVGLSAPIQRASLY